jgi:zinc protease
VAKDCASLKSKLLEEAPSPITYNSPKPPALLEEDKTVSIWKIGLQPGNVRIIDAGTVFE